MSSIRPFRALRPSSANVDRVAAVPYDVVNTEEARTLAAGNPLSFLHVSRAEIDLPPGTDPYSDAVYEKARENFATLRARRRSSSRTRRRSTSTACGWGTTTRRAWPRATRSTSTTAT